MPSLRSSLLMQRACFLAPEVGEERKKGKKKQREKGGKKGKAVHPKYTHAFANSSDDRANRHSQVP